MFQIMSLSLVALTKCRASLCSSKKMFLVPKLHRATSQMNNSDIKNNQKEAFNKHLFQEHMNRAPDVKKTLTQDGDPLSVIISGTKALLFAMLAASGAAVLYGAYDSGYRRTLRKSFPWAAQLLDLVMEEEGPSIIEEDKSEESAAEFRKTFAK